MQSVEPDVLVGLETCARIWASRKAMLWTSFTRPSLNHALPAGMTDEQVRFAQLCIQRYQHDQQGTVKTKLAHPKPKKPKADKPRPLSPNTGAPPPDLHSDALLERLTHAASEDDVIHEIEAMSDAAAEKWDPHRVCAVAHPLKHARSYWKPSSRSGRCPASSKREKRSRR
jgi:hypothetical protein